MSTRNSIIALLRKEALTASELAGLLDVTRNAIIVPLRQLEAEGIIEGRERKAKRVGKPALEYRVLSGTEDLASKAYPAFAEALVQAVSTEMSAEQVEQLMVSVGKSMAAAVGINPELSSQGRLEAARAFLDSLGANTDVEQTPQGSVLRSFSCPLGRAVRQEPCVCGAVESFLSAVTGVQVRQRCNRAADLRCEFLIDA